MAIFTIKDLALFSGLKQHTIRSWELRYGFLNPDRSKSLQRIYSKEELSCFMDFFLLNQGGVKISKIVAMSVSERDSLKVKSGEQQKAINNLIVYMADMDVVNFENVVSNYYTCFGIHRTIQELLIPFAERTGLFQKSENKSYFANLVLVREVVKQKISFGTEVTPQNEKNNKLVITYLSGKNNEFNLIYLNYLLRHYGFNVLYLGNIDSEILKSICLVKKPDYIVTDHQHLKISGDIIPVIEEINLLLPATIFIAITGQSIDPNRKTGQSATNVAEVVSMLVQLES